MDISKYTGLFHDGAILDIQSKENCIEFFMHSAEVDVEDLKDNIPLSREDTIAGKLHVEGVLNIELDKKKFQGSLERKSNYGSIYDWLCCININTRRDPCQSFCLLAA